VVTPNIVAATSGRAHHSGHRARRVRQDARRDRVDAGHVGDRRHHRHVDPADVVARVSGGHRRDHQLGHADRQRLHRGRRDRRVARAAGAQHAVDATLVVEPARQRRRGVRHAGNRRAAVTGRAQGLHVHAGFGADLLAREVRLDRGRLERADVGQQHAHARVAQALAQEGQLVALRVERAQQQDGALAVSGR
jgi:hypothetical protein